MAQMRLVIADDSNSFRAALRKVLATVPGAEIIAETGNGADTLVIVRETVPDLLILDLHMPIKSGWDVLRELQAGGDRVRVLVLTGYNDAYSRQQALRFGAAAFVAKGNARLLIDTLMQLMDEPAGEAG